MARVLIEARKGRGFRLRKGEELHVISPTGTQVADLFCVSEARPTDALSSGRSIDYNETVLFTKGHILFSNDGRPMLEIIEDTCGRHDFLVTPCSQQMFNMISKTEDYHPSCHENLCRDFEKFDLPSHLITTTFNIFMNYRFDSQGRLKLLPPTNKPGDSITFRALEDLIVALTACSDEATNGGTCKPIEYQVTSTDGTSGPPQP